MKNKKFNPKLFLDETRIEKSILSYPNIRKLWNWNHEKNEYQPARGNLYVATRKRFLNGKRTKEKSCFADLESAKTWQNEILNKESFETKWRDQNSIQFKAVVDLFIKNKFPLLRPSTQELYRHFLNNSYFKFLYDFTVGEITPRLIDQWIMYMKEQNKNPLRESFEKEYDLLKNVLNFHLGYDDTFISPIRPRHKKDIVVKRKEKREKNLSELEFIKFRTILESKYGLKMAALATVQFYQALRICEAAALTSDDILINELEPYKSKIRITKSVRYKKDKTVDEVQNGFKNSKSNHGIKELSLLKEPFDYLTRIRDLNNPKEYLFRTESNQLFSYRQIQHAYNRSFKLAGIDMSATHVMRHGGASNCYDRTNGDLGAVQQILGNSDLKSVQVYAKRSKKALEEYSHLDWIDKERVSLTADPQKSTEPS